MGGGACAVTDCNLDEAPRALHAKRWCNSNDGKRLDPANGLPLTAKLDAIFDAWLIAFCSSGAMLVSHALSEKNREEVGVSAPLGRKPTKRQAHFLQQHVETVFRAELGVADWLETGSNSTSS